MDENLIKDILKIGRLITKPENIQEQVIGMGSETGLAKTNLINEENIVWSGIMNASKVKSAPREWQSYPCVVINGTEKEIIDSVWSTKIKVYVIGDTTFYNNGNYKVKGNENNGKYSCNGNEIVYNTEPAVKKSTSTSTPSPKSTKKKTVDNLKPEQCAKACNDRYPYYSVICDGGKWKSTLKSWIAEKGGGEDKETYRALRTSWCSGWRPGQTQQATTDFVAPVFTTTTTVLPQNFGSDAIL